VHVNLSSFDALTLRQLQLYVQKCEGGQGQGQQQQQQQGYRQLQERDVVKEGQQQQQQQEEAQPREGQQSQQEWECMQQQQQQQQQGGGPEAMDASGPGIEGSVGKGAQNPTAATSTSAAAERCVRDVLAAGLDGSGVKKSSATTTTTTTSTLQSAARAATTTPSLSSRASILWPGIFCCML